MPLVFWKVYIVGKIHLCPSLQYSLVISLKSIFFFHKAYISISWVVCYICQMEVSFCCILEPTLCMMQHKSYSRLMDVQSIPSFSHKSIFKVFNWICIIPYFWNWEMVSLCPSGVSHEGQDRPLWSKEIIVVWTLFYIVIKALNIRYHNYIHWGFFISEANVGRYIRMWAHIGGHIEHYIFISNMQHW